MSLKICSITKKYGDKTIFTDFSYDFDDKGIYAITGMSGIGKTTLLRMICGLDKDYSGEIISSDSFSVVFQEYRLFSALTALQNATVAIEKPTLQDYDKAKYLLRRLGFTDNEIELKPNELSGGMKQRVSLVRAFMKDCDVYLLDEATKELDSDLAKSVLDVISEYSKNHLVILVTHNLSDISYLNAKIINLSNSSKNI